MSSLTRIIITGCNGQIGSALMQHPLAREFNIVGCDKKTLDITEPLSIQKAIYAYQPHIIINTAAYTAVDAAESDKANALAINYHGTENLAKACQEHALLLYHLSTDYIFNGQKKTAYDEEENPAPINFYGESKLKGENAVRTVLPHHHLILRVSAVFSAYGNNFLKKILQLSMNNDELNIVSDQITCPTHANHIATVIYLMLKNTHAFGTYHYCDQEATSWHSFAEQIIQNAQQFFPLQVKKLNPIKTHDYETPATRPLSSQLLCDKIKKDYGIDRSHWSLSLVPTLEELASKQLFTKI